MENADIFYGPLVYFWPFDIRYGHLVYFVIIWYMFPRFGILYKEESGTLGLKHVMNQPNVGKI
jgi:hypothetical protein